MNGDPHDGQDSICPVGSRIGEWRRNRCHHLPGRAFVDNMCLLFLGNLAGCRWSGGPTVLFLANLWVHPLSLVVIARVTP